MSRENTRAKSDVIEILDAIKKEPDLMSLNSDQKIKLTEIIIQNKIANALNDIAEVLDGSNTI